MTAVLSTQPWLRDPNVVPLPWRQEIVDATLSRATADGFANRERPLKLGILWTDGVVTPHPPISRGLRLIVDAVRRAGHQVSLFPSYRHYTNKAKPGSRMDASISHDREKGECRPPDVRIRLSLLTYSTSSAS